MSQRYVTSTQVASSVPFDETTGKGFTTPLANDVQAALEHLRDHTVYDSRTQATTAAGTLTLTSADTNLQYLTGTAAGYNIQLPAATTLTVGAYYQVINQGSQGVQIKDGSGANLFTLGQTSIGYLYLQLNGTAAGTWVYWQIYINTSSGILNYNVVSSTAFTTSSQTDVVITGLTLTPQAGTYAIWYNSEVFYTTTPKTHFWSIYKGGSVVADSVRQQDTAHSSQNMVDSTMTIAQVDGTQAVDIRVKCDTTGSLTINQRSLLLIRLGN